MKRAIRVAARGLALAGLLLAGHARGSITIDAGPALAPIGGGGYSGGSGNIGLAGGLVWNYAGLDLSQSDNLYWGLSNQDLFGSPATGLSLDVNSAIVDGELFGATGFTMSGNQAVWSGVTSIRDWHGSSIYTHPDVQTRLTISMSGTGQWVVDPSLNNPGFAYTNALWEITGGTAFSANLLVEFLSPHDGWMPYITGWESLTTIDGDTARVSVTPGWYWENSPPSVPEPSTLAMFLGLGGMGLTAAWRRRKRTA